MFRKDFRIPEPLGSWERQGEPKLSKPLVLKGIKQVSSIPFIRNKATCSVFVKDNDVYSLVKNTRDFSHEMN